MRIALAGTILALLVLPTVALCDSPDPGRKKAESLRARWLEEAKREDDSCTRSPTRRCLYLRARVIAINSAISDNFLAFMCIELTRQRAFLGAAETARGILRPGLRAGQLIRTADAQAAAGQTKEAASLIGDALPMVDSVDNPLDRVNSLSSAAVVFSKLQDRKRAQEFFGQALQILGTVLGPTATTDMFLRFIAVREVEAGFDDQAQALLSRLSEDSLSGALGSIAEMRARQGNVAAARAALQQMKRDPPVAVSFLVAADNVATALANRDEISDAIGIRDLLKEFWKDNWEDVDDLTWRIAQAAADKGHIDQAMELAGSITNRAHLAQALVAIGRAQARAGNRELAAFTFRDAADYVKGRLGVAVDYVTTGRLAIDILTDIAIAEAKAGFRSEASAHLEAVLATIDAPPIQIPDESIGHLAAGFTAIGKYAPAFALYDRISDDIQRVRALEMMAEQLDN